MGAGIATVAMGQAPAASANSGPTVLSMPPLKDYYTPEMRSAGEKGTVRVKVCLDKAGQLTSATVLDSSGFERLDKAAEQFLRAVRFKPAMAGGVAQDGCFGLPIAFTPEVALPPPPPQQPPARRSIEISAPSIDDYYPEESIKKGEQGSVKVKICYNAEGRVTSAALTQTSGYLDLDDAAVSMGRNYRFKSSVKGEALKPDCIDAPMSFRLTR